MLDTTPEKPLFGYPPLKLACEHQLLVCITMGIDAGDSS